MLTLCVAPMVLLLAAIPPAAAPAPLPVDMSGAVLVGDGTAQSCTGTALRQALEQGGKVQCACGPDPVTIELDAEIVITKNTVFDGGGNTISGRNTVRLFRKRNVSATQSGSLAFTVQNVTLQEGVSDTGGGAVYNETFGTFTAINVRFLRNRGVLPGPDRGGGAIYSLLQEEVILAGCHFENNEASNGGAVGGIGTSYSIFDCTFSSNRATGSGGGADAGPLGQGGIGGAVYIDNVHANTRTRHLRIYRSTFFANESNAHGGALFCYFQQGSGSCALLVDCSFIENRETAHQAGAIYFQNDTMRIENCTFAGNTAVTQGGALWMWQGELQATNSTFAHNSVTGDYGLGGALTVSKGHARLTNCTFAANSSRHFASAIMNSDTVTLLNTLFSNNLHADGPHKNVWAGIALNATAKVGDLGGSMQWPDQQDYTRDAWLDTYTGIQIADAAPQALANNGGPTLTMALPPHSPARNGGERTGAPATDQRGVQRGDTPDIGAYEYCDLATATPRRGNAEGAHNQGTLPRRVTISRGAASLPGVSITARGGVYDPRGRRYRNAQVPQGNH